MGKKKLEVILLDSDTEEGDEDEKKKEKEKKEAKARSLPPLPTTVEAALKVPRRLIFFS